MNYIFNVKILVLIDFSKDKIFFLKRIIVAEFITMTLIKEILVKGDGIF